MTDNERILRMFVILLGALGGTFEFREDAIINDKFFDNVAIHVEQDQEKSTIRYTIKRHKIVEGEILAEDRNTEQLLDKPVQEDSNNDNSVQGK